MAFTALIMVIWMDYLVTDIKDITSKRRLVYINYEPAFGLYAGELITYDISIDKVIPQNVYDEIIKVLTKRATLRGVNLIKDKDYTEYELRQKLLKSYYPTEAVDAAIIYAINNKFIDDRRYAFNYVSFKAENKSRKYIENRLKIKGINDSLIEAACEEYYCDNDNAELIQIEKLIKKKLSGKIASEITYEEKQKIFSYLYRKGYTIDCINKAFNEFLDNTDN